MKKLVIALLVCLSTSYAVQAQTKEETITWLQEKLQKYAYIEQANYYAGGWTATNLSVKVNECAITYQFTLKNTEGTWTDQYYIIPTTGMIFNEYGNVYMDNDIKAIKQKYTSDKEILTQYSKVFITKGEENLYERIKKAVDHLATFCQKQKKLFK